MAYPHGYPMPGTFPCLAINGKHDDKPRNWGLFCGTFPLKLSLQLQMLPSAIKLAFLFPRGLAIRQRILNSKDIMDALFRNLAESQVTHRNSCKCGHFGDNSPFWTIQWPHSEVIMIQPDSKCPSQLSQPLKSYKLVACAHQLGTHLLKISQRCHHVSSIGTINIINPWVHMWIEINWPLCAVHRS